MKRTVIVWAGACILGANSIWAQANHQAALQHQGSTRPQLAVFEGAVNPKPNQPPASELIPLFDKLKTVALQPSSGPFDPNTEWVGSCIKRHREFGRRVKTPIEVFVSEQQSGSLRYKDDAVGEPEITKNGPDLAAAPPTIAFDYRDFVKDEANGRYHRAGQDSFTLPGESTFPRSFLLTGDSMANTDPVSVKHVTQRDTSLTSVKTADGRPRLVSLSQELVFNQAHYPTGEKFPKELDEWVCVYIPRKEAQARVKEQSKSSPDYWGVFTELAPAAPGNPRALLPGMAFAEEPGSHRTPAPQPRIIAMGDSHRLVPSAPRYETPAPVSPPPMRPNAAMAPPRNLVPAAPSYRLQPTWQWTGYGWRRVNTYVPFYPQYSSYPAGSFYRPRPSYYYGYRQPWYGNRYYLRRFP